jgi:Uma2 family endonuclease
MMIAAKNIHRWYQTFIHEWFVDHGEKRRVIQECNVQTSDGVKAADIAWCSVEFLARNKYGDPYQECPEVVIEVISPSNTPKAIKDRMSLFFERGAKEVWLCASDGKMRFFDPAGELERSGLFEEFPEHIDIEVA